MTCVGLVTNAALKFHRFIRSRRVWLRDVLPCSTTVFSFGNVVRTSVSEPEQEDPPEMATFSLRVRPFETRMKNYTLRRQWVAAMSLGSLPSATTYSDFCRCLSDLFESLWNWMVYVWELRQAEA